MDMKYGECRRSISFNLDNPHERAMYEHSKQINFSRLVKTYLARELKRQQQAEVAMIKVRLGEEK